MRDDKDEAGERARVGLGGASEQLAVLIEK